MQLERVRVGYIQQHGQHQATTDFDPTEDQLKNARERTQEVVEQFEASVGALGALHGLSNLDIEERLYEFRNNLAVRVQ
jgi:hypothetical protein